jgi:ABC-2 type transport system ATP-binding protein
MNTFVISTHELVKQFKTPKETLTAVDQLSLDVSRGETYGLIGPDGAGKTTAIRVILGLLTRTEGESNVLGFDSMRGMYQIRERVGYIAQQFSLPAMLTVLENMQFFANLQGVKPAQQKGRIDELLAFAGLSDFTTRQAGKLSGGMKKKLALACSLIHEPEVVFLDEPTLGVDPVSRREFWSLLGSLQVEKSLTIFVSTPYMDEAERCTQVGLMYKGKLIASGTPASIKGQLPGHLLELLPSDLASAQQIVTNMDGVLEIQTYGDKLHLFVDDVAQRAPQIESALKAAGIQNDGLREIEVRMEEAFISLVRRYEAEHLH